MRRYWLILFYGFQLIYSRSSCRQNWYLLGFMLVIEVSLYYHTLFLGRSCLFPESPTGLLLFTAQWHLTVCNPVDCSTPGFPVHHHLPEYAQTHVHWVGDATQPPHSLSPPSPPASVFPSIRVFPNELTLHIRWPKYWSFSYSISSANEYLGLISFRTDLKDQTFRFDLLVVQGTLKNLLQDQLESINSSALSDVYGPTLASIHEYWKNHSFDYRDLCWQCDVSAF